MNNNEVKIGSLIRTNYFDSYLIIVAKWDSLLMADGWLAKDTKTNDTIYLSQREIKEVVC